MDSYFDGVDAMGAEDDIGVPFVDNDPSIGVPYIMGDVDILGIEHQFAHVLGYIDIAQSQRRMNELKTVTIGVAQALLTGGFEAIDGAIRTAKDKKLPNLKTLDNARWKLIWHRDNLAKFGDRNAPYKDANDLKKWVMQAFIEANAVEEGALYIDSAWTRMWNEISAEIAKLPQKVREEASKAVQNITGLPVWGWIALSAGALLLVGGVIYAVLNSRSGAAISGAVARKYLR